MKELVHVHLGQPGIRMGQTTWDELCLEHGIDSTGQKAPEMADSSVAFNELSTGVHVPRAVFADLNAEFLADLNRSHQKGLFNKRGFVAGSDINTGDNILHARYVPRIESYEALADSVRRALEACSKPEGFLVFNSLTGGAGPALADIFLSRAESEFGKLSRVQLGLWPSGSQGPVDPYNATFALETSFEHATLSLGLQNKKLLDTCSQQLGIELPDLYDVNHLIGRFAADFTAPIRSPGPCRVSLTEIETSLVPHPLTHFALPATAPLMSADQLSTESVTVDSVTQAVLEPEARFFQFDWRRGVTMACKCMYRGEVTPREVLKATSAIGVTQRQDAAMSATIETGLTSVGSRVKLAMLTNTTAIIDAVRLIAKDFDAMYSKRAFVHWFVGVGVDDELFSYNRNVLDNLIDTYKEFESLD